MVSGNPSSALAILLTVCPVCGSDDAEPVGVVGPFDGADDAVLSLRCGSCTTVYLNPEPAVDQAEALSPASPLSQRWLRRLTRGLPRDARILVVECDGGAHSRALSRVGPPTWTIARTEQNLDEFSTARGYDLILLPHSLEATCAPQALLRSVRSLLADTGRAVVIVSNTRSPAFNVFGGRHWHGYRYPGTRQHFSDQAVQSLSSIAGLEVRSMTTMAGSDFWLTSTANLFRDWALPAPLIQFVSRQWVVPATTAWVAERISVALRRGSLLVARLGRA